MATIKPSDLIANGWNPELGRGWCFVPRGYPTASCLTLATAGGGDKPRIEGMTYAVDNMTHGPVDALAWGCFSNDLAAKIGDVVLANAFKDAITRLNGVLILG